MKKNSSTKNQKGEFDPKSDLGIENERWRMYEIPKPFDLDALADSLCNMMKNEMKVDAECIAKDSKRIVKVGNQSGYWNRIKSKTPGSLILVLEIKDGGLLFYMDHEDAGKKENPSKTGLSGLKWMASLASEAAADFTDAAVSGFSEVMGGSKTEKKLFAAVKDFVLAAWRDVKGELPDITGESRSRYVEAVDDMEFVWLVSFLRPGERIIAWLYTSTPAPGHKDIEQRYLMTSERSLLAGLSHGRPVAMQELPAEPLFVKNQVGRDDIKAGDIVFRTQLHNEDLYHEIADLPGKSPEERIREAALRNFVHAREQEGPLCYALDMMQDAVETGDDVFDALTRMYIELYREYGKSAKKDPGLIPSYLEKMFTTPETTALLAKVRDPDAIRKWANRWELNQFEKIALCRAIQKENPEDSHMASLLTSLIIEKRDEAKAGKKNEAFSITMDLLYAENLIFCGREKDAEQILSERLSSLPDESYLELLPSGDSDLTRGEGGMRIRITFLKLLARARGSRDAPDPKTMAMLAGLQPLVPDRLRRLASLSHGEIRRRAETLLHIMESPGWETAGDSDKPIEAKRVAALSSADIENRLRHPASREGTALRKLQNFVAAKKSPDHQMLKTYAKRVNPDEYPDLMRSIVDGSSMLGIPSVEAYISFGDLNTGIKGFEGDPPFILIGGDHLNLKSDYYMRPSEIRFNIGAELAHIRYKHERITNQEVWEGVFDKAMSAIEFVPLVGGYIGKIGRLGKVAGHASDLAKYAGNFQKYVGRARDITNTVQGFYQGGVSGAKKGANEKEGRESDLVGAFSEMQFTSDRAALLLCDDPAAAVGAIFKGSARLRPELPVLKEYGLKMFLERTGESGELMFQEIAMRIAALFSFYLSEDYAELRKSVISG